MQWLILILASCLAIGFCMLVFALKARRQGSEAKLHNCSNSDGCHCQGDPEKESRCRNLQLVEGNGFHRKV